jgi:hypothetical protein
MDDAREWRLALDREISLLPERFRSVFVLCCLEGKSMAEAAGLLGCPPGTVMSRLARARQKLQRRLGRCGLDRGAALAAINPLLGSVALPASLVRSTAQTAALGTAAGGSSMSAVVLSKGVLRAMFLTKLKWIGAVTVATGVAIGGSTMAFSGARGPADACSVATPEELQREIGRLERQLSATQQELAKLKEDAACTRVPARQDGVIEFIGATRSEPIRIGDNVREGQLLAQLDDRLARIEVSRRQRALDVAKAELQATDKTRDEAYQRYLIQQRLFKQNATAEEDLRGSELVWHKSTYDANSKREGIHLAEVELEHAQALVKLHQIRSPVDGRVKAILHHAGEAVKTFETVFLIGPADPTSN